MYHALLAHGLLDLVNVLPESDEQRVRLERAPARASCASSPAMRHPDGEIALFNDAAFGIAPEPGAILDYAARLGLETPGVRLRLLPRDGLPRVAAAAATRCVVDAGPIGPDYLSDARPRRHLLLRAEPRRAARGGGRRDLHLRGGRRARLGALDARAQHRRDRRRRPVRVLRRLPRRAPRAGPRDVAARVSAETACSLAGWHDGYRRLRRPPDPPPRARARRARGRARSSGTRSSSRVPHAAVSRVRFPPGARVRLEGHRRGDDRGRRACALAARVRRRRCRSRRATTPRASASGWRARCWRCTRARGPSSATCWRAAELGRGSTPRAPRWPGGRSRAGAGGRPTGAARVKIALLSHYFWPELGRAERAAARDGPRVGGARPRGHGRDQLPEPPDRDRSRGLPRALVPDRGGPGAARHPLPHLRDAQPRLR